MEKQNQKSIDLLAANINAVKSLVAAVKGTLGPKGLDVMLVDEFGQPNCTNDGVEILSNLKVNHPVSKLVSDALKAQELQVGDGTTSTAVLIEAMLDSAYQKILSGYKIQKITKGMELALNELCDKLTISSQKINKDDKNLKNIVNISARENSEITELILQAHKKISDPIKFDLTEYIFGSLSSPSQVIEGIFIKKKTHFNYDFAKLKNLQCLVVDGPFEPESLPTEVISTNEGVKKLEQNLETLFNLSEAISKSGVKAILTSGSMFPAVEEFFARENIFVLTHLKKSDINNLLATSTAELTNRAKLKSLKEQEIASLCGKLTTINFYEDLAGYSFVGEANNLASLIINADTETILDEKKRICTDAIRALQASLRSGFVVGEGVAELNLIKHLKQCAQAYSSDPEITAGFAVILDAMQAVFFQILKNAEIDPLKLMSQIDFKVGNELGIDLDNESVINLIKQGILDPLEVKISAFKIAAAITTQILRINLIVQSK